MAPEVRLAQPVRHGLLMNDHSGECAQHHLNIRHRDIFILERRDSGGAPGRDLFATTCWQLVEACLYMGLASRKTTRLFVKAIDARHAIITYDICPTQN